MIGLVLGTVAAALAVTGIVGLRMLRTTGLEDIEADFRPATVAEVRPGLAAALDALGGRLLGLAMRAYGPARLRRLEETIRRAGRPDGVTLTVYLQRQSAFVVLGLILLLLLAVLGQPLIGLVFFVVLAAWMRVWLVQAASARQVRMDSELPDFLDVLGVTVSAGLSFRQAVERVCEFHHGPLADEMRTALREMSVGVSRRQAFVAMRERTRSEGVSTFVTALLQAEELGVPLSNALDSIGRDVRRGHAQQVRQAAARATPKISLAVTLTVVPGALILIVAAVLISNREAFGGIF